MSNSMLLELSDILHYSPCCSSLPESAWACISQAVSFLLPLTLFMCKASGDVAGISQSHPLGWACCLMVFSLPNTALHSWTVLVHRPRYRSGVSGLHSTRLLRCALESFFDARPSSSGVIVNGQQHERLCNGNGKNNFAPLCMLSGVSFKFERFRLFSIWPSAFHSRIPSLLCSSYYLRVRSSMSSGQSSSQYHSVAGSLFCTHACPSMSPCGLLGRSNFQASSIHCFRFLFFVLLCASAWAPAGACPEQSLFAYPIGTGDDAMTCIGDVTLFKGRRENGSSRATQPSSRGARGASSFSRRHGMLRGSSSW